MAQCPKCKASLDLGPLATYGNMVGTFRCGNCNSSIDAGEVLRGHRVAPPPKAARSGCASTATLLLGVAVLFWLM